MKNEIRNLYVTIGIATATLAFVIPPASARGGNGSHGGGAFVCRDSAGKIQNAVVVDLYEASAQYGLTLSQTRRLDVSEQLERLQKRSDAAKANRIDLWLELDSVERIMRLVPNARLENTNDFQLSVSPKVCRGGTYRFEQLAAYTKTGELLVEEEIWGALDQTQRAALLAHEAIYALARKKGAKSSLSARRAVAYLMSDLQADQLPTDLFDFQYGAGFGDSSPIALRNGRYVATEGGYYCALQINQYLQHGKESIIATDAYDPKADRTCHSADKTPKKFRMMQSQPNLYCHEVNNSICIRVIDSKWLRVERPGVTADMTLWESK